jgi:hypothetical protein
VRKTKAATQGSRLVWMSNQLKSFSNLSDEATPPKPLPYASSGT